MKTRSRHGRFRGLLDDIMGLLEDYDGLRIKVELTSTMLAITAEEDESTPRRDVDQADEPAPIAPRGRRGKRGRRGARRRGRSARSDSGPLPSADDVVAFVSQSTNGCGLEELATHFDVRPRTKLRAILDPLVDSGKVSKNKFTYASPPANSGKADTAAPKKARTASATKTSAEPADQPSDHPHRKNKKSSVGDEKAATSEPSADTVTKE